jgi:hypothetical protein
MKKVGALERGGSLADLPVVYPFGYLTLTCFAVLVAITSSFAL